MLKATLQCVVRLTGELQGATTGCLSDGGPELLCFMDALVSADIEDNIQKTLQGDPTTLSYPLIGVSSPPFPAGTKAPGLTRCPRCCRDSARDYVDGKCADHFDQRLVVCKTTLIDVLPEDLIDWMCVAIIALAQAIYSKMRAILQIIEHMHESRSSSTLQAVAKPG
jgi:hypothetical protein